MAEIGQLVGKLAEKRDLSDSELKFLIENEEATALLGEAADKVRREVYGDMVFIRGLIEMTNFCRNNCLYCGIRRGNTEAVRYRLSEEEIMECCRDGYALGFRTFVLQGGEDLYFNDERMCGIVSSIRKAYPDVAITLSLGERTRESYQALFDAGANRYLLRHETATEEHYRALHPAELSLANRKRCLLDLKEIGYQVGSGFMVGSPFQTTECLIADLRFLQELDPDMIGIGPFIPHEKTPFADKKQGGLTLTLRMLSILRLMFPHALLPSTTALGTIDPNGRELGLKAGANVVMPNLSPASVRRLYDLYENKISSGEESAQCREMLEKRVINAGYRVVTNIGNVKRS